MAYSKGIQLRDEISEKIIEYATHIAHEDGIGGISVKRIITDLGYTNRVFYNRFKNIDELLKAIYDNIVFEMRKCIEVEYDPSSDYYEFLLDIATSVLKKTFENKLHFSQYMFEFDTYNAENRNWWIAKMKRIIDYGIEHKLIRQIDPTQICYSVWCFCRGYNASTIGSDLTIDEIISSFRLGFGCFIEGLKP